MLDAARKRGRSAANSRFCVDTADRREQRIGATRGNWQTLPTC
jgi:hypothetical protein